MRGLETPLRIRPWAIIAGFAALLTAVSGCLATGIERAYVLRHGPWDDDPGYYSFYNARLWAQVREDGRLAVAWREWTGNARHPLRTTPNVLAAPGLLASPTGHVATMLPALFAFLFLLGWTVLDRTGSRPFALASMLVFCAIPGLYDPRVGIASNWLDLPAALLVGAAAMCLINSNGARSLRWLAAFGVLAACAALSRYIAAAFVFVAAAPILAVQLRGRRREGVLAPLGVIAAAIAVPAGYFLVAHLRTNASFYTTYGYALGQDIPLVARFVGLYLKRFLYAPGMLLAGGLLAVQLACFWPAFRRARWEWALPVWLAVSIPLFLIFGMRVLRGQSATFFAVPMIFVALATPVRLAGGSAKRFAWAAGLLAAAALLVGGRGVWRGGRIADEAPGPQRAFDVELADHLSIGRTRIVWYTYFDEVAWIPTLDAFYRHGSLALPAGQPFFHAHEMPWKGDYPGLAPAQIGERVYAATCRWVDLAVVLDDPAADLSWMSNDVSRAVARDIAARIRGDGNWTRVFEIESPRHGKLAGYGNLTSNRKGYGTALRGELRP